MYWLCKIGLHKFKDEKVQITKGICYGLGEGTPGMRVVRRCSRCGKASYEKLNMAVPYKDLMNHKLWR